MSAASHTLFTAVWAPVLEIWCTSHSVADDFRGIVAYQGQIYLNWASPELTWWLQTASVESQLH